MLTTSLSNKKLYLTRRIVGVLFLAVIFMSACAPYQAHKKTIHYKAIGNASWYGPGFAGKKTANGERFNPMALTAAHKTLPFGTTLKVTNADNGQSVVVRVNDRGPFIAGRIIDLSKAAATKIGMMGTGTAKVELVALANEEEEALAKLKDDSDENPKAKRQRVFKNKHAKLDPNESDSDGIGYIIAKETNR